MHKNFTNNPRRYLAMMLVSLLLPGITFAAARATPFTVGETTDPGATAIPCGPADANCYPTLNVIAPTSTTPGSTGAMLYQELLANGTNTVGFRAPDSVAANIIWTLPGVDGTTNQVLTTNGTGTLSWTSISGSSAVGGNGAVQFANGAAFTGDNTQFTFVSGNLGIGTSSPYAKLSVAGDIVANRIIATSTATSTFTGGIQVNLLRVVSTTASSTFSNGINLTSGCFAQNGTCVTGGGGSSAVGGTGAVQFANGAAFNGSSTQFSFVGGNVGIGTSTPAVRLDIAGTSTDSIQGPELIANSNDRDFTGAGNWTGVNWNVAGGVASHAITGANAFTLNDTFLTTPIVAGRVYIVTFDVTTTATAKYFGLQVSVGGGLSSSSQFGDYVGTESATAMVVAGGNGTIVFAPSAIWTGTIDNISITEYSAAAASQILRNQDSSVGLELRAGGSGQHSVYVGNRAGEYSGSNYSVAIGEKALTTSAYGFANNAIGYSALQTNIDGTSNQAIGYGALINNTRGSDNVAIGDQAMWYNTLGYYNVAVGSGALNGNYDGYYNTAIGYQALYNNDGGSYNVTNGSAALYNNKNGAYNVASGYNALFSNLNGSSSVAIGWKSLYNTTNSSSTAVGTFAGLTNTTGKNNLFVGDEADALSGTLTNATAIGSHAKVGSSSALVLGGTGAFAVKVGIGTTTPWTTLSVQGNVALNGLTTLGATGDAICIVAGGQIERNAGATSCLVSSRRFKENIVYTDPAASLATIMQLHPASYEYIGTTEPRLGLIAEDVDQVEPRLVARNASGTPQSVRYEELTSVLAGAVQALNGRVERLEGAALSASPDQESLFARVKTWLADGANGIGTMIADIFIAREIHTGKICVVADGNETCLTKSELDTLLGKTGTTPSAPASQVSDPPPADTAVASDTPASPASEGNTETTQSASSTP